MHQGGSNRTESLGALLSGSRTTLFYALPVENGCWWVPILRVGEECFGVPALRPTEFAGALDEVLEQIEAGLALHAIPIGMAPSASFKRSEPAHLPSPVANASAPQPVCIAPLKDKVAVGGCAIRHGD
jgi:hypothetical protein